MNNIIINNSNDNKWFSYDQKRYFLYFVGQLMWILAHFGTKFNLIS